MKKWFWVPCMFILAAALTLAWSIDAPARRGLPPPKRQAITSQEWAGFAQAGAPARLGGQAPPASSDRRVMVESYYKIAPGKTGEWLELYRTQHLPVLQQRQRDGQILGIVIYRPFLHLGEPAWDFKVLLTYRDFAALGDRAAFDAIEHRLYPDREAHQRAEQRRWEITAKHWDDLMVVTPAE